MEIAPQNREAALRLLLARYFAQLPSVPPHSEEEQKRLIRAYGTLLRLEERCLCGQVGCRPLFSGDVAAVTAAVLGAYRALLPAVSFTLLSAPEPIAPFDPRRLPLAITLLLRCCGGGAVCIRNDGRYVQWRLTAEAPFVPHRFLMLAYRAIAACGGRLLLTDRVAAFALPVTQKNAVGKIDSPTAKQYLLGPLSPVRIGFYASPSET